ncbi:beta-1,3-galactosyltransferase 9-like [Dermacentor albipictus]|uniref:beta-1,3-galactosyltransferase 9-like n=1 Tax=Dermacentor albipictus TaxID=60249 RepID=UPI0038FCB030
MKMTSHSKRTPSSPTMSVLLAVTRHSRSPTTLIVFSFLSMVALGLLLHHFTGTMLRQHFPTQLCQAHGANTTVVVAVRTKPNNRSHREAIRKSMGHPMVRATLPWKVVFYMGYSADIVRSRSLRREVLKGDLIIAPYEASFENTIDIFMSAVRWIHDQCAPAMHHLVHTNDTTMVDFLAAHEHIEGLQEAEDRHFHCAVVQLARVDRNPNSSLYVPEALFRDTYWPTHCEGDAFIVHSKHLKPLVLSSEAIAQYPLLGPYVTGHLPVLARIGHRNITSRIRRLGAAPENQSFQRPIFVSNVTEKFQWKAQWLKTLVCYADANNTGMAERILRKVKFHTAD